MDLKVMSTSFRRYNYLLVICCNNSRFIITYALNTRKVTKVAESIFKKLICIHGTNIMYDFAACYRMKATVQKGQFKVFQIF